MGVDFAVLVSSLPVVSWYDWTGLGEDVRALPR